MTLAGMTATSSRFPASTLSLRNRITQQVEALSLGQSIDDARPALTPSNTTDKPSNPVCPQNDVKIRLRHLPVKRAERLDQTVSSTTAYQLTSRTNDFGLNWAGWATCASPQLNARYGDNSQFGDKATGSAAYGYQFDKHLGGPMSAMAPLSAPPFQRPVLAFHKLWRLGDLSGQSQSATGIRPQPGSCASL